MGGGRLLFCQRGRRRCGLRQAGLRASRSHGAPGKPEAGEKLLDPDSLSHALCRECNALLAPAQVTCAWAQNASRWQNISQKEKEKKGGENTRASHTPSAAPTIDANEKQAVRCVLPCSPGGTTGSTRRANAFLPHCPDGCTRCGSVCVCKYHQRRLVWISAPPICCCWVVVFFTTLLMLSADG